MRNKFVLTLAAVATLGAATAVGINPANAALTTTCRGEAGAVTVPGDLVVPANASCELDGTTIQGNVRVGANADLLLTNVTVEGATTVSQNGYVDAVDSTLEGALTLTTAYGAYLETSTVTGKALTRAAAGSTAGFVYSLGSNFGADVQSNAGELYLEDSDVTGGLNSTGSVYADVYGSWIDGNVLVRTSTDGSVFCGVVVGGTSRFLDNTGPIQLGSNGPAAECDDDSYWGGNVTVSGTEGESYIDNNIVNGNLSLANNAPLSNVGAGNKVRGTVNGDFTEWDGSAMRTARSAKVDRGDALKGQAEQRTAAGEKRAVGKAF